MKTRTLKTLVVAIALAAAFGTAYSLGTHRVAADLPVPVTSASSASRAPAPVAGLPDMSAIIAKNGPAVVNISVTGTRKVSAQIPDFPQVEPGDPFFEFFKRFGMPQQQGEAPVRGMGSGFIVKADGTILTNAHVVDGADEVTVKLTDKREFKAKVAGVDKASDVAVLKIDAKDLPTVTIGNSGNTRVGEWVLAIGAPYGFENSASAGIVSAKSRALPDGSYVPFIQTDVAVNPGNSGGPLFNMAGEVVGINSQIYSRSGGYQGLSFAIPIELAMNVEGQLIAHGKVQRGKIGVSIQELNQALASSFGLETPNGALVSSVEKGGPAAAAGLEPGDVILSVNGKDISDSRELPVIIAGITPGSKAQIKVWRKRANREFEVKVGSFEDSALASQDHDDAPKGKLGVAVRALTPQEQKQADIEGGLLVENSGGPAARAGIQAGDIIVSVNGSTVRSVDQLKQLIGKAGKQVAILIERGEARIYVPVNLG